MVDFYGCHGSVNIPFVPWMVWDLGWVFLCFSHHFFCFFFVKVSALSDALQSVEDGGMLTTDEEFGAVRSGVEL